LFGNLKNKKSWSKEKVKQFGKKEMSKNKNDLPKKIADPAGRFETEEEKKALRKI
jgi:hypothetical protein